MRAGCCAAKRIDLKSLRGVRRSARDVGRVSRDARRSKRRRSSSCSKCPERGGGHLSSLPLVHKVKKRKKRIGGLNESQNGQFAVVRARDGDATRGFVRARARPRRRRRGRSRELADGDSRRRRARGRGRYAGELGKGEVCQVVSCAEEQSELEPYVFGTNRGEACRR